MNAVSKCKGENFKLCMCDPYDVFNKLKKYNLQENKLVVDSKKDKKAKFSKVNFFSINQIISIITHFIQKFKMICK